MTQPSRPQRPRVPAFHPVPVRTRSDGWTPVRQAEFIGVLAETGSVSAAAEFVGMARETAYRLRRKAGAEEFARAWDVAVMLATRRGVRVWPGPAMRSGEGDGGASPVTRPRRMVTQEGLWRQVMDGMWRPVLRRGRYCGSTRKDDASALLRYLARLDRALERDRRKRGKGQRSHTENGRSVSDARETPAASLRPPPEPGSAARYDGRPGTWR
jgi:hypothetical protein